MGHDRKHQKENTESDKRQSDIDEAVLLKDWDFARFFPARGADAAARQRQAPARPADKSTHDKLSDIIKHKKEQDAELNSPNRFFRGFRRENSDFFPLPSTRHSAIYFPKHESPAGAASRQLRSSGIFNNSRKQVIKSPPSGEPILTDFIKMNDSLRMSAQGEVKKTDKKINERKVSANNPIDALKNVAALIRQDSESNGPSRQSSVNSDSPATSICFTRGASLEKAGTPDLTANTLENNTPVDSSPDASNIVRPRREKTESDIVFRRNSHYNRHSELMTCGQEAVLAQDKVICSLLRIV